MASVWTTIPDSDIDPDSPFTTGLATAYRENVIAAFEGAAGAPRSVVASMVDVTAASYQVGGDMSGALVYHASTPQKVDEGKFARAGTIRFRLKLTVFSDTKNGINNTAYGRIYVDGVAKGTLRSVNSNQGGTVESAWFTDDVVVTAGQLVQFYGRQTTGVSAANNSSGLARIGIVEHVDFAPAIP